MDVAHDPVELALVRPARPAEPPRPFRSAMTKEEGAATAAPGLPAALGHVGLAASLRPGPGLQALPLPGGVVTVARADKGVSNLVQERFFP